MTTQHKPLALALLIAALGAQQASATIIASEGFDAAQAPATGTAALYDTTSFANSQLGTVANADTVTVGSVGFSATNLWNNNTSSARVRPTGLSHNLLAGTAQLGSLASTPATGTPATPLERNVNRQLSAAPADSSTYFLSALVTFNSATAIADGSFTSIGFYSFSPAGAPNTNDAIYSSGIHVGLQRVGSVFQLAVSDGDDTPISIGAATLNVTYQIVVRLDTLAAGNETLTAWYAANGDAALTSTSVSSTTIGDVYSTGASVGRLALQSISTGAPVSNGILFDEVRLGTAFEDVTSAAIPEPSSFAALAGVALLGFAASRRRRSV
jgi:PEP-CTERM motif